MSKINEPNLLDTFDSNIRDKLKGCSTLEEAAQSFISNLYSTFSDSVVLARMFTTIPYGNLPETNKQFVNTLAKSKDILEKINDNTLVLSLIGTDGKETNWKNWKTSTGHIGIPLASSEFIGAIPMMSRLLKQLGLGLDWIDSGDTEIVQKTFGSLSGLFYVNDALNEVDSKGRKIITAQDFVKQYNIKTVFGFGGGYIASPLFCITIIFTNEYYSKTEVNGFVRLISSYKSSTSSLIKVNKFYK